MDKVHPPLASIRPTSAGGHARHQVINQAATQFTAALRRLRERTLDAIGCAEITMEARPFLAACRSPLPWH